MLYTRLEIDSDAGHVAIERKPGANTIRIDSIIREPKQAEQTWKTWELDAAIKDQDLFEVATEVQQRTDGKRGTNSMVYEYFRELRRFQA